MSDQTQAYPYLLSGRVQGVGFRHFTRTQAQRMGLTGTVANLDDGRVEIEVEGDPDTLSDFEERIRQGPRAGRVRDVERHEIEPGGRDDFRVVFK